MDFSSTTILKRFLPNTNIRSNKYNQNKIIKEYNKKQLAIKMKILKN